MKLLFATGNQGKADRMAKWLGMEIDHKKLSVDEIQSMKLQEVAQHKVRQAFEVVQRPVLIDDTALELDCLSGLPGPFVAHFIDTIGVQGICNVVSGERGATARTVFGYYDGKVEKYFEGSCRGEISAEPRGEEGFGWDPIFIPQGYQKTRAELARDDPEAAKEIYMKIKPINELKNFLESC